MWDGCAEAVHLDSLVVRGRGIYAATGCFLAYFFSGHSGIYSSQRVGAAKAGEVGMGVSLKMIRDKRAGIVDIFRRKKER